MGSGGDLVRREVDRLPGWRAYWAGILLVCALNLVIATQTNLYVSLAFLLLFTPAVAYGWLFYFRRRVRQARADGVILDWSRWETRSDIRFGKVVAIGTFAFFAIIFVVFVVWAVLDA
jgi:hypothetical protein